MVLLHGAGFVGVVRLTLSRHTTGVAFCTGIVQAFNSPRKSESKGKGTAIQALNPHVQPV